MTKKFELKITTKNHLGKTEVTWWPFENKEKAYEVKDVLDYITSNKTLDIILPIEVTERVLLIESEEEICSMKTDCQVQIA